MSSLACVHVCMCAHAHTCVCMCVCVHVCARAHLSMLLSFCYFSAAVPPCLESFFPLLHRSNLGKALSPTSPPLPLNEFFSTSSFEALRAAPCLGSQSLFHMFGKRGWIHLIWGSECSQLCGKGSGWRKLQTRAGQFTSVLTHIWWLSRNQGVVHPLAANIPQC